MASVQQQDFERVLKILEFKILSSALKPRERLIERELMETYRISRGTVRKIIKELAVKNLINHVSNRGAVVAEPTPKEVEDIYHARLLLESYAIDFVVANMNSTRLQRIEACEDAFERAVTAGDLRGMLNHNREFHRAIFQTCGNAIISEMIDQLRNRSRIWHNYMSSSVQNREKSIKEHRAMIHCLHKEDGAGLKSVNEEHLTTGYKNYKGQLVAL